MLHFAHFVVYIYEVVKVLAVLAQILINKSVEANDRPSDDSLFDSIYISRLYQQYKAFLFQKAGMYTTDPSAKEDIVQDTVLRLIGKSRKLRTMDPAALVTYLALSARSAALNYLRAEQRERLDALPLPDDDEESYFPYDVEFQPSAEELVLLNHRKEEVRAALSRLSDRDQIALTGKYYLELDNRELAEILDVTPGALRTLLSRARDRLLKQLGKESFLYE